MARAATSPSTRPTKRWRSPSWPTCSPPKTGYLTPAPTEAPLVPVIFDRYAHGRDGARALAVWLNEAGHRTKAGRPWNHTAVSTVLHDPVYVDGRDR
ncbi:MAG: recombinase family protein [Acidimicrobiales bacterium]